MKIILMGQQAFGKSALEKFHTGTDHELWLFTVHLIKKVNQ